MKKVLFVIVFSVFFSSTALANDLKKVENFETVISDESKPIIDLNNSRLKDVLFDCTVSFDLTITLPSGTTTKIKGRITVEGKSCIELIKESIK